MLLGRKRTTDKQKDNDLGFENVMFSSDATLNTIRTELFKGQIT